MAQTEEEAKELEKQLCCVCNGKGIQPGENPLCIDHYQSEVLDKKAKGEEKDDALGIRLQFDESGLFVISFVEGEKAMFQVKLTPASFEKLTNDMIKIVKNFNLHQAQQYQEAQNAKKEAESAGKGGELSDLPNADNADQTESEQPTHDSGQAVS